MRRVWFKTVWQRRKTRGEEKRGKRGSLVCDNGVAVEPKANSCPSSSWPRKHCRLTRALLSLNSVVNEERLFKTLIQFQLDKFNPLLLSQQSDLWLFAWVDYWRDSKMAAVYSWVEARADRGNFEWALLTLTVELFQFWTVNFVVDWLYFINLSIYRVRLPSVTCESILKNAEGMSIPLSTFRRCLHILCCVFTSHILLYLCVWLLTMLI